MTTALALSSWRPPIFISRIASLFEINIFAGAASPLVTFRADGLVELAKIDGFAISIATLPSVGTGVSSIIHVELRSGVVR